MATGGNRRDFLKWAGAAASVSALSMAWATDSLSSEGKEVMKVWLKDLNELCFDLRLKTISPVMWQERMAILYQGIDPQDLMNFIDFPTLVERLNWPEAGAAIAQAPFPILTEAPHGYGHKIFGLKQGRAVIPHGHNGMVSAHFVLKGSFHARTYNRRFDLEQAAGNGQYLFLEPSLDTSLSSGDLLTMSDERDNVHWLVATSEEAFTFDVPITQLEPDENYAVASNRYSMIFIEPPVLKGDDAVPARVIGVEEGLARFG